MSTTEQRSIEIRPDSGVYGTFRRISYRFWSAIAEFIDNSTQNYFEHKQDISKAAGTNPTLARSTFSMIPEQRPWQSLTMPMA